MLQVCPVKFFSNKLYYYILLKINRLLQLLNLKKLAEDLDTLPIWVLNAGVARDEGINTTEIGPFVQV